MRVVWDAERDYEDTYTSEARGLLLEIISMCKAEPKTKEKGQ